MDQTLRVDATVGRGVSQELCHSHFSGLTLKNAVVDSFRESNRMGARPSVDTDAPDAPLHLYLDRGGCRIYRSLAHESLHKRGYRGASHRAALRPTVAAGLLYLADWPARAEAGAALCDPMCGSGTILVEAALMARRIAPGLARAKAGGFACARWPDADADAWDDAVAEAEARAVPRRRRTLDKTTA